MTHAPNEIVSDPFEVSGLIDRYLSGDASPDEIAVVGRWISADPERAQLFEAITTARQVVQVSTTRPEFTDKDAEEALGKVHQRTMLSPHANTPVPASPRHCRQDGESLHSAQPRRWWVAGLSTCAAIAVVWGVTRVLDSPRHIGKTTQSLHYATQQAQRARIELADGSTVWLAPESRLTVAEKFGTASREIMLDGEALFTVPRITGLPFVVRTNGAETRVLGTMFTVRRYASDTAAKIVVAEGKVSVGAIDRETIGVLTIGEEATVSADGRVVVRSGVDMAASLGWTQGRLVFTSSAMDQVLRDMRRLFGFDVQLSVELSRQGFSSKEVSGMITETMRAADAARLLAGILGVRVVRDGSTYILAE